MKLLETGISDNIPESLSHYDHNFIKQFNKVSFRNHGERKLLTFERCIGFLGRDRETGRDALNIYGRYKYNSSLKNPYKIICFYTEDNGYVLHAERLKYSLDKFGLSYNIVPIKSYGSWERNCSQKAKFIRDEWEKSDIPIVWLDADATVESYPKLFNIIDTDFAAHKWKGCELCSGTIYFGKTELAKYLLDQWVLRCEADPLTWDQVHLDSAWNDINALFPLRTIWLPRSYCQIFDASGADAKRVVIKHWQGSREVKNETSNKLRLKYTRQGKKDRRNNLIFRNPEDIIWVNENHSIDTSWKTREFPDSSDIKAVLIPIMKEEGPLLEIGSGIGKIASLFKPEEYIGVDINPYSVLRAKQKLPNHNFRIIDEGMKYPESKATILSSAIEYMNNDRMIMFLSNAVKGKKIFIISQIISEKGGNRKLEEYISIMKAFGFKLYKEQQFSKFSFLFFKRKQCTLKKR